MRLDSLVGKNRRDASADLICALLMPVIRVIDTSSDSRNGHYVNRLAEHFSPQGHTAFLSPNSFCHGVSANVVQSYSQYRA